MPQRPLGKPVLPAPHSSFEKSLVGSLNPWLTRATTRINNDQLGAAVASASTIVLSHPVHHVTGTAAIETISVGPGEAGHQTIIPDGAFTLGTSGNIAIASTAVVGRRMDLFYDAETQKWYPSY